MKTNINRLFEYDKKCFDILNLLIAVRERNTDIITQNASLAKIKEYFQTPEKIYEFFCETGLDKVFISGKIKNLHDYVFGVEVGLDTNARKNRGGDSFAQMISKYFKSENICFQIIFIK
ncbi:DpnII family type II restriction endonuclease [Campylobacter sp.]|uniref:DpnII family type II restriction endonuclease n=1 Tax=Campylobacter sp. TaxID=205 RepID=UPI002710D7FF|nr:DpnII family type II restriction endonuclease [Campylobacter sp.]